MGKAKVLVLRAPGTNCDVETAFAFEQAGAQPRLVHVNELIHGREHLSGYGILVVPGGFTYGDDLGAGKILANEFRLKLGDDVGQFVGRGGLILGICNGFQVMAKAGLLPEPDLASEPRMTLASNDSGRFECRWVYLAVNQESPCIFTRRIERMYLPVAHGEGKVVGTISASNAALYYTDENGNTTAGYPFNPNGSETNIAGVCDSSGRIFALMPHPERHIRGIQHPRWTRGRPTRHGDGFQVFVNAVEWAKAV